MQFVADICIHDLKVHGRERLFILVYRRETSQSSAQNHQVGRVLVERPLRVYSVEKLEFFKPLNFWLTDKTPQ